MKSRSNLPIMLLAFSLVFLAVEPVFASDELISACKAGDLEKVKELVGKNADVNYQDGTGATAISTSFFWPEITKFLLDNGADPNGGTYPAVVSAANNYSVEVLKLLLAAGADVNKPGKADPGAGLRKMLEDEKAKGKNANKATIAAWEGVLKNMQPMEFYAVQLVVQATNCVPCLEQLLDNGAKLDVIADGNLFHTLAAFGMTPEGRKEAFAAGKPGVEAYGLKVPEWYASLPNESNGTSKQMVDLMVAKGLDLNAKNSAGLTPLLTALGVKKAEVAQAFVDAGSDVTYVPENNGRDAVAHAAEIGDVNLLKSIIDRGADVNLETWDLDVQTGSYAKGFTALTRAAIYNNYECAELLIKSGCKIKEGVTGYFSKEARSSINGNPIKDLITGKQLYCRYKLKNKMAIYFAIENNNLDMVKLLAANFGWFQNHSMEMDPQVANLDNSSILKGACMSAGGKFTPSRYAKTLGFTEIQKYLESEGK